MARADLVTAGVVQELLHLLGGKQSSRRAKFDCIMLLSDLLESAIASDAAETARWAHRNPLWRICRRHTDVIHYCIHSLLGVCALKVGPVLSSILWLTESETDQFDPGDGNQYKIWCRSGVFLPRGSTD